MVLYCLCFIVIYKKPRTFLVFVYLDLQGNNQEHGLGLMRSGEEGDQWRVTTQHASMQNKVYRVKVPTVQGPTVRGPIRPEPNSPRTVMTGVISLLLAYILRSILTDVMHECHSFIEWQ